jgi:dopamine beta-monooxygenase
VTQHFRAEDGLELPELDRDNHYSTHYQEIRLLANPVKVFPVKQNEQLNYFIF